MLGRQLHHQHYRTSVVLAARGWKHFVFCQWFHHLSSSTGYLLFWPNFTRRHQQEHQSTIIEGLSIHTPLSRSKKFEPYMARFIPRVFLSNADGALVWFSTEFRQTCITSQIDQLGDKSLNKTVESLRSLLAEIRLDREVGGGAGSRYWTNHSGYHYQLCTN